MTSRSSGLDLRRGRLHSLPDAERDNDHAQSIPAPTREIPLRAVERLRADGHRLDLRPALFDETRRPVADQREVIADERAA